MLNDFHLFVYIIGQKAVTKEYIKEDKGSITLRIGKEAVA